MRYYLAFFIIALAKAEPDNVQEFVNSSTEFAPHYYLEIAKIELENVLASPFSTYVQLSLLQFGCKGETGQELRSSLFLPNKMKEIVRNASSVVSELKKSQIFTLVDEVYVKKEFPIRESFKKAAKSLDAEAENVDFSKPEEVAEELSKKVEGKTGIKNFVSPSDLTPDTEVLLLNSLKLEAKWSIPFGRKTEGDFYKTDDDAVKVDMLHLENQLVDYLEVPQLEAQFVGLSLEGGARIHIGISGKNILDFEKIITENFQSSPTFEKKCLNLALPKFTVHSEFCLESVLKELGITKIFSEGEADLSGIAGKRGDLKVSKILQKTLIQLHENGVGAIPATSENPAPVSGGDDCKNVTFNRPFIFLFKIQEVVAFIGRVTDPKS